jgi:flagellar FliJ protein
MASRGFRLGQVLEHRRRIEEQKQLALRVLLAEEQAVRASLQELHARVEAHVSTVSSRAHGEVIDASAMDDAERYLEQMEALIELRRADLDAAAEQVAAARAELVTALQERRALEMLQARQEAEARREAALREAREVDDITSARYTIERIEKGASA